MAFSDVDARLEITGSTCEIELKSDGAPLPKGQEIALRQITGTRGRSNIAFVAEYEGNASKGRIKRFRRFWKGRKGAWIDGGLAELNAEIERWVSCEIPGSNRCMNGNR